ncbi:MAG: GDP-mannose 4,6-dehydratase [Candidatus Lokiarchaeota archaeon]|nr:GDP-mannose 4,6-dehydratase [Candidatus Lokiarchaeota archaeon]
MTKKILITGGAGFIGSHLADFLIESSNDEVTVLDCLDEQVHGKINNPPDYLNKNIKFILGSVNDQEEFEEVVKENEIIFHLAAKVGVGQSMYQIRDYVDNNILGMGNLLNILVNSEHDVKKIVIASSNTVYGEGKASCAKCGIVFPKLRILNQMKNKNWNIQCPKCEGRLKSLLTDENALCNPSSIYALSKRVQEEMGLMICKTYGIDITILRFFLVYGPRQALSNPYTGVFAIFCTRLLNGKPPIVFEDGLQSRDFVNVKDICQALMLAMKSPEANGEIFNVGTGIPLTIKKVAENFVEKINPKLKPIYNQQYRVGDIRHCVADISKIKNKLGYDPKISFDKGIEEYINWIKKKEYKFQDKTDEALAELKEKGLLK